MFTVRYKIKFSLLFILYLTVTSLLSGQHFSNSQYDVTYYDINLEVSDTSTLIKGYCSVNIENNTDNLSWIVFELSNNLVVDSVFCNFQRSEFYHRNDSLFIANGTISDQIIFTTIYYQGNGKGNKRYGINSNYVAGYHQQNVTWTLCEPFYSKLWFPVKQDLNDKADSVRISLIIDTGLVAVSNGLLDQIIPINNAKNKFVWKTYYPIDYYLISLAVSDYYIYEQYIPFNDDSLYFVNYIYNSPSYVEKEKRNIDTTIHLIKLYSELFGTYPFANEKYGHVLAPIGGGMEHQTITTLANFNFELVAHELAHQWWGNLVTCSSWQDIWINEGFASYAEYLAIEHLHSKEKADEWLQRTISAVKSYNDGSVYISDYPDSVPRIFSSRLSYDKGAVIIHLLRKKINNDPVFFEILRTFLAENAFSTAGGETFRAVAERISGISLTDFFDDWYYGDGFPEVFITWQSYPDYTIIEVQKDRNYEFGMNLTLKQFNGLETKVAYEVPDLFNRDTFYVDGLVKNILTNEMNDELILITGIEKTGHDGIEQDIILTYDRESKQYNLYFFNDETRQVKIMDTNGKTIISDITTNNYCLLNMNGYGKGLYILEVKENKNKIYRKKIILF